MMIIIKVLSYRQLSQQHITPGLCPGLRPLRLVQPYRLVFNYMLKLLKLTKLKIMTNFAPKHNLFFTNTNTRQKKTTELMLPIKLTFSLSLGENRRTQEHTVTLRAFVREAEQRLDTGDISRRASTLKNYRTALRSLAGYAATVSRTDNSPIDNSLLHGYQQWLKEKGVCRNTTSCYLRSLRSLYSQVRPGEAPPFAKLFTGNDGTMKRALSPRLMTTLAEAETRLKPGLRMWHNIFLFSVLAMGMPFVDVVRLAQDDINGDVIMYRRCKTGHCIVVPLLPEMRSLIERYKGKSTAGLLFPVLKTKDADYHDYCNALARYNRALKTISAVCGFEKPLTSYVARHTWASIANGAGINIHHIAQALGHRSIKTTEIYLAGLQTDELFNDSRTVAERIKKC